MVLCVRVQCVEDICPLCVHVYTCTHLSLYLAEMIHTHLYNWSLAVIELGDHSASSRIIGLSQRLPPAHMHAS